MSQDSAEEREHCTAVAVSHLLRSHGHGRPFVFVFLIFNIISEHRLSFGIFPLKSNQNWTEVDSLPPPPTYFSWIQSGSRGHSVAVELLFLKKALSFHLGDPASSLGVPGRTVFSPKAEQMLHIMLRGCQSAVEIRAREAQEGHSDPENEPGTGARADGQEWPAAGTWGLGARIPATPRGGQRVPEEGVPPSSLETISPKTSFKLVLSGLLGN